MTIERIADTNIAIGTKVIERTYFKPRSQTELFNEILLAKKQKRQLDPLPFMTEFLDSYGLRTRTTSQAVVDPSLPLMFLPNHYHNPQITRATTAESMKNISIVTVGAKAEGLHNLRTAWFIKYLPIYLAPGRKARMVQNAAPGVFDYIGVKVGKNGIENPDELYKSYQRAKEQRYAIGYFPEQEPSTVLKKPHENLQTFISFTNGLYDEPVQFIPTSVMFDDKEAQVHFGKVVVVNKNFTKAEIAQLPDYFMEQIAELLPVNLRGPYP